MEPTFFATPAALRRWFNKHHASARELWVGYYRKGTGRPSITWPQSVDQALCFGWIDGIRKSVDDDSYKIRFTPRKPKSNWSAVNLKRAQELIEQGLMQPAGLTVFQARDVQKSNQYSFERDAVEFDAAQLALFRANRRAWAFFQAQPPGYRKTCTWWVLSAKQEATRGKRLAVLIADSAAGQRIAPLRRASKNP
jgi:uncharacterized protein YdeI (YjbR/CyaY-like superfamily)